LEQGIKKAAEKGGTAHERLWKLMDKSEKSVQTLAIRQGRALGFKNLQIVRVASKSVSPT
jgi:hypothetical protein